MNVCRTCEKHFDGEIAEIAVCRGCYYSGAWLQQSCAGVIAAFAAAGHSAVVSHTGGGCFAVSVEIDGCEVLCGDGEAFIPEPGEPWKALVTDQDGDTYLVTSKGPIDPTCPDPRQSFVDLSALVAACVACVREIRAS